jgi:hypothetical protein
VGACRRLSGFLHEKFSCWASLAHLFELGHPGCPLLAFRLRQFLAMEWVAGHLVRPERAPVHAAPPHLGLVAGAALDAVGADYPEQRLLGVAQPGEGSVAIGRRGGEGYLALEVR